MGELSPSGSSSSTLVLPSIDEDDGDAMLGQGLRLADMGAEQVAILRRRGGEVGDGDGDVVEAADHC